MQAIFAANLDRQGLRAESIAMTSRTSQLIHIGPHLRPSKITIGLMVATVDIGDNPLKRNINITHAAKFIFIVEMELPSI